MGLVLDSSVVIAAERSRQSAYDMIRSFGADNLQLAISVITALELMHGVERAKTALQRNARQGFLNDLLVGLPVEPVTVAVALRAGRLDAQLQVRGIRVSLADLLIGATALELGYQVATRNERHFAMIPGVSLLRL